MQPRYLMDQKGNFTLILDWVKKKGTSQQTFERRFDVVFRLIRRRDVPQRQINVETKLCTSTLKFTTLNNVNERCVFQRWFEQR